MKNFLIISITKKYIQTLQYFYIPNNFEDKFFKYKFLKYKFLKYKNNLDKSIIDKSITISKIIFKSITISKYKLIINTIIIIYLIKF